VSVFNITVAFPLSAGRILILLSDLSVFKAFNSKGVRLDLILIGFSISIFVLILNSSC